MTLSAIRGRYAGSKRNQLLKTNITCRHLNLLLCLSTNSSQTKQIAIWIKCEFCDLIVL
jgi:hypothetical protein